MSKSLFNDYDLQCSTTNDRRLILCWIHLFWHFLPWWTYTPYDHKPIKAMQNKRKSVYPPGSWLPVTLLSLIIHTVFFLCCLDGCLDSYHHHKLKLSLFPMAAIRCRFKLRRKEMEPNKSDIKWSLKSNSKNKIWKQREIQTSFCTSR